MPADPARRSAKSPNARRIALLTTYPPRLCGLATFGAALESSLNRTGDKVDVIAVDDGDAANGPNDRPLTTLLNGSASSVRTAAAVMSRSDVAIVQHEYGIYGGPDGAEVLDLLGALTVPSIVILHTVPLVPTPHQRLVLESVCRSADRAVVMTDAAGARLLDGYDVDPDKIVTIAHGAANPAIGFAGEGNGTRRGSGRPNRPQLLTWGLLGPGKGIEHAIDAMSLLRDLRPRVRYTIAGVTHPKVLAHDGDAYREGLVRQAWSTGVAGSVVFDDSYRDVPTLTDFVASASLVVLPYDSRDQVTSGVLVDAIAAGRPVIATAFPHAVELLASGAGIVVPHEDPVALAAAIRAVVSDPLRLEAMACEARRIAPSLRWSAVADSYRNLCDVVVAEAARSQAVAM